MLPSTGLKLLVNIFFVIIIKTWLPRTHLRNTSALIQHG